MIRIIGSVLLLLTFLFLLHPDSAQAQIVERQKVDPATFEFTKSVAKYADAEEFSAAKADQAFALERILYKSGEATVSAYLFSPAKLAAGGKLPVIVFNRGDYVVHDQAPGLLTMFRRLGQQGFIVLAPMLRGSDGTTGHDEMGGADLADLHAAMDLVKDLPGADAAKIFLYGESRGAMMTYFALREQWPVRAVAVFGGITNMGEYLQKIDPQGKLTVMIWPDYAKNKTEILRSRSAIEWPEKINAPILIMHGGADGNVSPLHSLRMAEKLTSLNKEYALHVFAEDNHILTRNRVRRDAMAVEWFKAHM